MKNQIIYTSILAVILVYMVAAFVEASFNPFLWPRDTRITSGGFAAGAVLFFVFAYNVAAKEIEVKNHADIKLKKQLDYMCEWNLRLITDLNKKKKTGTPAPEQ